MANELDGIIQKKWSKADVEQFVSNCYDRQALMAALISYAREFMTHRILMRIKKKSFRPFLLQGWPDDVDEDAKTPRLRKLQLPAATTPRVKKALQGGHEIAAMAHEFGLSRVLQFLGTEIDEELLCLPITVGPRTEWILVGKPIRIDPNSEAFSSDAITLNFWELEEVCDKVGAQYQRIRRMGKADELPPEARRIPSLDAVDASSDARGPDPFSLSDDFEPVEVNKRSQQRANANADDFSADRFLAGEDAFMGERSSVIDDGGAMLGAENSESSISDVYTDKPDVDASAGVTTGTFENMVDPRTPAQVNYEEQGDDDEAPSIFDIEHTAGIQLDESVLSEAKKAYHRTVEREERERRLKREAEQVEQPAQRQITKQDKARIRRAIAVMDSNDRKKAFKAARFIATFGDRCLKTLGRLFPGRLFVDRYQYQIDDMPPVEKHGPVLRALVELGEPARRVARHYLDDSSNDLRFYAMYLYTRIPVDDDLEFLVDKMHDRDRQTRTVAQRVVASQRDTKNFEYLVLQPLRNEVSEADDELRQAIAIEMVGRCRDVHSIDNLIDILKFKKGRPAQLAHVALQRITMQDFSAAAVSWEQWWRNQRPDHKDHWLVQGLGSKSEKIREQAWREMIRIDGIDIDYHPNYPRGRRKEAQQDLAVWLGIQVDI